MTTSIFMTNNYTIRRGISFSGLLTLILLTLKLFGKISVSWLWVFAPIWLSWAVVGIFVFGVAAISFVAITLAYALDKK